LIPRVVLGVMLWYVTGWGYLCVLFPCYVFLFISWCWTTFKYGTLLCCWCWSLSAKYWLKYWRKLFKINSEFNSIYIWWYFEERNVTSCLRRTLIYYILFICWENGVLQLVSEQVGPSGQVVKSLVSCDGWILSSFFLIIVRCVVNREWCTFSRTKNILREAEL